MSLGSLRKTLNEEMLRFLWRQWSQLGVARDAQFPDSWIVDPEALLVFTMTVGRCDPRLFDEVIDWTVRNGRWISLQRLKNIAESADEDTKRVLTAFAAVVDSHDTKHRWRSILQMHKTEDARQVPLFHDVSGKPLPTIGEPDTHFHERGLERSSVVLRGLSVSVPMNPPTNLLFKLRSVFGLAPRAEVAAYLMTHSGGKASDIARSTVYSHPAVSEALAEMVQSGLVYMQKRGFYSLDADRWARFLEVPPPLSTWIEWPRAFAALSTLTKAVSDIGEESVSDYLVRSRALTLNETVRDMLSNTGLPNPFLRPCGLDDATEALGRRATELASALNARRPESRG